MGSRRHHGHGHPARAGRPSRAWLILPVLGIGLLIGCLALLLRTAETTHTVSEVRGRVQEIALRRSRGTPLDDGGVIGPWWIFAESIDEETGALINFRVSSGPMEIAARSARVLVDHVADTFSLELRDVVFTSVPERDDGDAEHYLLSSDVQVLGPAPYAFDIVPDPSIGTGPPTEIADASGSPGR